MKTTQKSLKIIISLSVALLLLIIGLFLNKFIIEEPYSYTLFVIIKTICLLVSTMSLFVFSYFVYQAKIKKQFLNFILVIVSTVSIFILIEIFLSFITFSTNDFADYSNKIWIKKHFKPINSLGYRDTEPKIESGKKNIIVIGDSFVAGHGIKNDEMFTSTMSEQLKNGYLVFNLGVCGSHTDREFDSLMQYPVKPDIIILAYYHNDIESAMIKLNKTPKIENPKDQLNGLSRLFVNNSLFANLLFSNYAKKQISTQFMESPNNDLLAYMNENLWNYQKNSLDKFNYYSKDNNISLIILFFPGMGESIAFSNFIAGVKLEEYCTNNNIKFVNLYPSIKNIPSNKRIVNKLDHHPSAEINIIVANLLQKAIKEL